MPNTLPSDGLVNNYLYRLFWIVIVYAVQVLFFKKNSALKKPHPIIRMRL